MSNLLQNGHIRAQMVFDVCLEEKTTTSQTKLGFNDHEKIWFTLSQSCIVQFTISYEMEDEPIGG